jgi:hypothetical protein
MKALLYLFLATIICINSLAKADNKTKQQPTPQEHIKYNSPNTPKNKNGYKLPSVDIGNCKYLDYYLYYCKPFTCSFVLPVPTTPSITFKVEEKKDNYCKMNYRINLDSGTGEKIPLKVACSLNEIETEAFRYEWKYYQQGYVDVFVQRSKNPLLKKACKALVEY